MADTPLVLVGAGLTGSLLATFLARRGHDVVVLERRPDLRKENISAGRSINLAISARGLHALRQIDLEAQALANAVAMRGRCIHPIEGPLAFQPYGATGTDSIHAISRGWLNRTLLDAAEATGRVRISFSTRVSAFDLDTGTLSLTDERTGDLRQLVAEHVIGTDGSASAIRAALSARGAEVSQTVEAHGYKELHIPADAARAAGMELHALHIWPRGAHMLIALPNVDGSYTCTLFLPFEGETSFASLRGPDEVRAFFQSQFPDAVPLMPTLEHDHFANPTGQMVTVRTTPWNAGARALLLGDAAHAIVPFFGQGMNCGFEDCVTLAGMLDAGASWAELFAGFGAARKPHADAIADMALENFVEMRDKVADPRFLLEKEVERALQRTFPSEFVSRYSYVSFTRAPYAFAYAVGRAQSDILRELCAPIHKASEVDLVKARELIATKLAPVLATQSLPDDRGPRAVL